MGRFGACNAGEEGFEVCSGGVEGFGVCSGGSCGEKLGGSATLDYFVCGSGKRR